MLIRTILFFWAIAAAFNAQSQAASDSIHITFQLQYKGRAVELNTPLKLPNGNTLQIHTLRFYLSRFIFLKNETMVWEEPYSYHLLDLEEKNTLHWRLPFNRKLQANQLQFHLGIDSLTNVSGAMGGDLDPTKGMFWTWQSGYINLKMEGVCDQCATKDHSFQLHLGGYQGPHAALQTLRFPLPEGKNLKLTLDLASFLETADWTKKCNIMSPGAEAVVWSRALANCFSLHAE